MENDNLKFFRSLTELVLIYNFIKNLKFQPEGSGSYPQGEGLIYFFDGAIII